MHASDGASRSNTDGGCLPRDSNQQHLHCHCNRRWASRLRGHARLRIGAIAVLLNYFKPRLLQQIGDHDDKTAGATPPQQQRRESVTEVMKEPLFKLKVEGRVKANNNNSAETDESPVPAELRRSGGTLENKGKQGIKPTFSGLETQCNGALGVNFDNNQFDATLSDLNDSQLNGTAFCNYMENIEGTSDNSEAVSPTATRRPKSTMICNSPTTRRPKSTIICNSPTTRKPKSTMICNSPTTRRPKSTMICNFRSGSHPSDRRTTSAAYEQRNKHRSTKDPFHTTCVVMPKQHNTGSSCASPVKRAKRPLPPSSVSNSPVQGGLSADRPLHAAPPLSTTTALVSDAENASRCNAARISCPMTCAALHDGVAASALCAAAAAASSWFPVARSAVSSPPPMYPPEVSDASCCSSIATNTAAPPLIVPRNTSKRNEQASSRNKEQRIPLLSLQYSEPSEGSSCCKGGTAPRQSSAQRDPSAQRLANSPKEEAQQQQSTRKPSTESSQREIHTGSALVIQEGETWSKDLAADLHEAKQLMTALNCASKLRPLQEAIVLMHRQNQSDMEALQSLAVLDAYIRLQRLALGTLSDTDRQWMARATMQQMKTLLHWLKMRGRAPNLNRSSNTGGSHRCAVVVTQRRAVDGNNNSDTVGPATAGQGPTEDPVGDNLILRKHAGQSDKDPLKACAGISRPQPQVLDPNDATSLPALLSLVQAQQTYDSIAAVAAGATATRRKGGAATRVWDDCPPKFQNLFYTKTDAEELFRAVAQQPPFPWFDSVKGGTEGVPLELLQWAASKVEGGATQFFLVVNFIQIRRWARKFFKKMN